MDSQKLIEMAKTSSNPVTILVELFNQVNKRCDAMEAKMEKDMEMKHDKMIEEIAMKLAIRLIDVQKGEDGHTPTDEELISLIKPLIPDPIKGDKPSNEEILALIRPLIPQIKDGVTPSREELIALITPLIPAAIPGKDGSPDTAGNIRDKLETLYDNDRLDATAIKGLAETIKSLMPEQEPRPIFGPGKTKIVKVDLSSLLDGSTKTFFLGTHYGIVDVNSSSAPFGAFREGTDYNESGKNIVFTSNVDAAVSLATGQSLIVKVLR